MRFKWDRKYLYWGLTIFFVFFACAILSTIIYTTVSSDKESIFTIVLRAFSVVILGFAFAYIMNPLLNILELPIFYKWGQKLFKEDRKAHSFSRAIGITLTAIVVLALLSLLLYLFIPKLIDSLENMASDIPSYVDKIKLWIEGLFNTNDSLILTVLDKTQDAILNWISSLKLGDYVDKAVSIGASFLTGIFNFFIGFVVALYVLAEKEKFSAQSKKILYSVAKPQKATNIILYTKKVNRIFTGFISGKIIESILLGIVCYIILIIFDIPYKEVVSVFIGVTNVIPFFGPFIGAIPSAILILTISPIKCLIFIIIILVLQQLDGNIVAPKILGESTGLSGFWVLCSLLVFGKLFGFVGMLVGVPTFAVIYACVKEFVHIKLKKKNITNSTTDFKNIDYIDPVTNEPVPKKSREELIAEKKAADDARKAVRKAEREAKKNQKQD